MLLFQAAFVLVGLVLLRESYAQQTIQGDCNVQFGAGAQNNKVTLICFPIGTNDPGRAGAQESGPLILEATVEKLGVGRPSFDLIVHNLADRRYAAVTPAWLSLSDDLGNAYSLDCSRMTCAENVIVQPGQSLRLPISLDTVVDPAATRMSFSLASVWSGLSGEPYMEPHGASNWTLPDNRGDVNNSDLIAEENAAGMTQADRREIEFALNSMGLNAGPVDGSFDVTTRSAIAAWQQARQFPATGYLTHRQAFSLGVDANRIRSQQRMQRFDREFDEHQRRAEEMNRRFDEDFQRRWGTPSPFQ